MRLTKTNESLRFMMFNSCPQAATAATLEGVSFCRHRVLQQTAPEVTREDREAAEASLVLVLRPRQTKALRTANEHEWTRTNHGQPRFLRVYSRSFAVLVPLL